MAAPLPNMDVGEAVDSVAHIIQVALTPVFLLSGIGTLLNVFNTRLSRVSDHREHVEEMLRGGDDDGDPITRPVLRTHLKRLRSRTLVLDAAVVLGAIGGASTCGAAFVLFLGSMRDTAIASWLFLLFGLALSCTASALVAFLADSLLAWHGIRRDGSLPRPK